MRTITELWLSDNRKYRIVKVVYPDQSIDCQVEELGPWPKVGVPSWHTLCADELDLRPKYVRREFEKQIAALT
jgi:hypothetical protein